MDGKVEGDETFALELVDITDVPLLMGRNIFYRRILQCTIIDSDGKIDRLSSAAFYL